MEPSQKKRATYQDVLDAPEHMIAEIIGGELRLSPRPGGPATSVASRLFRLLGPFDGGPGGPGGPGGWLILFEPELHLADEIVVPDLAAWRCERMPVVPEGAFCTVPPDWVCEVLSASTAKMDRLEKLPLYASFGIQYAWLVHPVRRTIEAFRLDNSALVASGVYRSPDRARIEPFAAIEIDLAAPWANVPLPMRTSEERGHYEHGWY